MFDWYTDAMVAATEAATEAAATQGAQATEVAMLLRGVAVQVRVRVRLRVRLRLRSRRMRVRVRVLVLVLVWSSGRTRGCGKCPAAGSSGTTRSKT